MNELGTNTEKRIFRQQRIARVINMRRDRLEAFGADHEVEVGRPMQWKPRRRKQPADRAISRHAVTRGHDGAIGNPSVTAGAKQSAKVMFGLQ